MLSRQIAQKLRGYETPFYLYDTALLRQTLESVVYESKKYGYKVHYAIKANYDDHLLAIIREYGLGIDCASGNELRKAVEAGFDPKGIVYAGVGKRDKELRYAIGQEIMAINCESIEELELVDRLAGEAGKKTDVALRINPDIDPKTNHCIDTGQADSKFGISYEEVLEHAKEIKSLKHINIVGIHLHIGSQIRELHVFENMCNKVNVIVENLEKLGCSFRFVDVGGGLGVNYDVPENEPIPNFASLFSIVHNHLSVGDPDVNPPNSHYVADPRLHLRRAAGLLRCGQEAIPHGECGASGAVAQHPLLGAFPAADDRLGRVRLRVVRRHDTGRLFGHAPGARTGAV